MTSAKVVIAGPRGSGKTTLIRTISDVAVIASDREILDHTRTPAPTDALDFGRLTIDGDTLIYLFGTQGAVFDEQSKALASEMLGFVLVVDRSNEDSFEEARKILEEFKTAGGKPFVVGMNNHNPLDPASEMTYIKQALELPEGVPVVPIDVSDKTTVKSALLALLYAALEGVEGREVSAPA